LENTYPTTNIAVPGTPYGAYVYGDFMFFMTNLANILKADFVNNIAYTTITCSTTDPINSITLGNTGSSTAFSKYIIAGNYSSSGTCLAVIFDMSSSTFVGFSRIVQSYSGWCLHPLAANKLFCQIYIGAYYNHCAIAAYKLPAKVTKTSANGMTATYELEVYW
jgi:hypothetical protein